MEYRAYDENQPPSLEEKLTAFLLGELNADEMEEVEAAVAADPDLAGRLRALEATVSLLRGGQPRRMSSRRPN